VRYFKGTPHAIAQIHSLPKSAYAQIECAGGETWFSLRFYYRVFTKILAKSAIIFRDFYKHPIVHYVRNRSFSLTAFFKRRSYIFIISQQVLKSNYSIAVFSCVWRIFSHFFIIIEKISNIAENTTAQIGATLIIYVSNR